MKQICNESQDNASQESYNPIDTIDDNSFMPQHDKTEALNSQTIKIAKIESASESSGVHV